MVVTNFSFEDFWFVICAMLTEQTVIFFSENQTLLTATVMSF